MRENARIRYRISAQPNRMTFRFMEIHNLHQWTELEIRERADLQRVVEEAL